MSNKNERRIVFFTKYTEAGASSRYRSFQYFPFYEKAGYRIIAKPLIGKQYIKRFYRTGKKPFYRLVLPYFRRFIYLLFLNRSSSIFIEYELFPYLPLFIEKWLLKGRKNIILDYDDAIFHHYDKSSNWLVRKFLADKIYQLVRLASVVITGSPYLSEQLRKHKAAVVEIPTSIYVEQYRKRAIAKDTTAGKAFIFGWIGSKTTSYNLSLVTDAFKSLQDQYAIELWLIGFDHQQKHLLEGVHHRLYEWNEKTEIELVSQFDAGIMPLQANDFNMGKCGFKLIQYMACGKPTISTPLPANIKINQDNENLFAKSTEEWKKAISLLVTQKEYFQFKVGEQNKLIVQRFYSIEANADRYIEIFKSVEA